MFHSVLPTQQHQHYHHQRRFAHNLYHHSTLSSYYHSG
jgi:hypothetical protein